MSMNLKDREESGEYICTCTCTLYWPNECNFNTLEDYLCYRMVLIAVMGTGSQSVDVQYCMVQASESALVAYSTE